MFKKIYATEKIHGTSAHVSWKGPEKELTFFSGGEKHENFLKVFDIPALTAKFIELFPESSLTVYGEAYGGKCQAMSATYGRELKFVAFEVKFACKDGERWYDVPDAEAVAKSLGLDFVSYSLIDATVEECDKQRDLPSEQAFKNGCADRNNPSTYKEREGIVLRPPMELYDFHGGRFLAKHKSTKFAEREHQPKVSFDDAGKMQLIADAKAIAKEWVTVMRLQHVLDRAKIELQIEPNETKYIPDLIKLMIEDVTREAEGEIIVTPQALKQIGNMTAALYKEHLKNSLENKE